MVWARWSGRVARRPPTTRTHSKVAWWLRLSDAARHAIALDASLHVNTTQATPPYPRGCASSLTHLPSIEHQSRQRLLGLRVGEAHDEITRQRVALDVVAKFENVTYIGLGAAAPATTGRPWRTPTLPSARPRSQGSPNYSLLRKLPPETKFSVG